MSYARYAVAILATVLAVRAAPHGIPLWIYFFLGAGIGAWVNNIFDFISIWRREKE